MRRVVLSPQVGGTAALCLASALGAACGPTISQLIASGQVRQACQEIQAADSYREWRDEKIAEFRAASDVQLQLRPLTAVEAEAEVGVALWGYGRTRLLVELTVQGAGPGVLKIESVMPWPPPADNATWGNYLTADEERELFPLPPAPQARHAPPGPDFSTAKQLLGALGAVTLITPALSAIARRDLVTPLLNARSPVGELVSPTEEEMRRYKESPAVVAAAAAKARFKDRTTLPDQRCVLGPGRRCRILAFVGGQIRKDSAWGAPAPPLLRHAAPASHLALGITHSFPVNPDAPAPDACRIYMPVKVPLRGGGSLAEQVDRSLSAAWLPLSRLPARSVWDP